MKYDKWDLPWVERGMFKGTCCGFNRTRKSIELPKLQSGTIEDAINEFFRNSKCDCIRATAETSIGEYMEALADRVVYNSTKEKLPVEII